MKFDCTPEQYHHGLDILWKALNNPPMDGRTVYARIADRIAELEAEVERVRGLLKDSYHAINVLTKRCEDMRLFLQLHVDIADLNSEGVALRRIFLEGKP